MIAQFKTPPWEVANGIVICEGGSDTGPGKILFVLRAPTGSREIYPAELLEEYSSLLVKAVNGHDDLVKALKLARARIEYLGTACNDPRHFEANEKTFLPAIDEVLHALVGGVVVEK